MKQKLFTYLKNVCQIIISIFEGWLAFWWLGFAYIEITEVDDLDSLWLRPYAMTMFIVGIGIVISKEIIMFRKNRSLKKYLLFSFLPFIITFIALYLYLTYFQIIFENCFLQNMLCTLREICSNKKDASLVLSRYTISKVKKWQDIGTHVTDTIIFQII